MSKNKGQSQARAEIRGNKVPREFSNKKGIQLVVTPYYDSTVKKQRYTRTERILQRLDGKTILQYKFR